MKTNSKKWILGLSALAFAGCLTFACGATINASADETQQPTVTATANENIKFRGISIRYNQVDGQDGIRFGTLINKDWYDALQGEVTTATVIVPTAYLASEDYAGVMAAAEKEVVETTDLLTYTVTIDDVTYYKPTVYIHSIDEVYYNTELTALSYVAIDGEVTYYTGELLQHSVASAAKWLVENGKEEVNDMKDYLYYTVTYRDTDGSVLDTQTVKYGKTPEFKGTIPAQRGYLFKGFGEMSAVTEDTEYTAQYYTYNPFTNYYYEAGKVVQLPSYETNFGEEVLTYTLNNAQVDPANVNMPAGTYTYSVRVGDIATIEDTVTFYDRETYETTFVKANSDQHLNYFIVNGNNSLTYNATENAYQFNATTSSQWDSRLNLNPAMLMGENAEYDETKYNSMKFDLKIAETTALPTALSYGIVGNFRNNSNYNFGFFIQDSNGNYVTKEQVEAGKWYTVEVVLGYYWNTAVKSDLYLYFFGENENGTVFVKNFTLGNSENGYFQNTAGRADQYIDTNNKVVITMDGTNTSGRTNVMKFTRSSGGIWDNGRASVTRYTRDTWNALYNGNDTYAYFVFDFCLETATSLYIDNSKASWNYATYYDVETGTKVTSFTAKKWYTVVIDVKKAGEYKNLELCANTNTATDATLWIDNAGFVSGATKACLDSRVNMTSVVPAGATGTTAWKQGNYLFSIWANGGTFADYTSVTVRAYFIQGTSALKMWRAGLTGWGNDSVTINPTAYNQWIDLDVTQFAQNYTTASGFILWGYAYSGSIFVDSITLTKADGTSVTLDAGTSNVANVSFNALNTSGSEMANMGMGLTVEADKYPA